MIVVDQKAICTDDGKKVLTVYADGTVSIDADYWTNLDKQKFSDLDNAIQTYLSRQPFYAKD